MHPAGVLYILCTLYLKPDTMPIRCPFSHLVTLFVTEAAVPQLRIRGGAVASCGDPATQEGRVWIQSAVAPSNLSFKTGQNQAATGQLWTHLSRKPGTYSWLGLGGLVDLAPTLGKEAATSVNEVTSHSSVVAYHAWRMMTFLSHSVTLHSSPPQLTGSPTSVPV